MKARAPGFVVEGLYQTTQNINTKYQRTIKVPEVEILHHMLEGASHGFLLCVESLVEVHVILLLDPLDGEVRVRNRLLVVGDPGHLTLAGEGHSFTDLAKEIQRETRTRIQSGKLFGWLNGWFLNVFVKTRLYRGRAPRRSV